MLSLFIFYYYLEINFKTNEIKIKKNIFKYLCSDFY